MEVIPVSRTFSNGVYSVTVNDDHSIRVRPGDWISKYSAAIYGDPTLGGLTAETRVLGGSRPPGEVETAGGRLLGCALEVEVLAM